MQTLGSNPGGLSTGEQRRQRNYNTIQYDISNWIKKRLDFRLVHSQAHNNYENIPAQCQAKAKTQEANPIFPFFYL